MEERLKTYLHRIEEEVAALEVYDGEACKKKERLSKVKENLLTQIQFFQHERLVHLLVTILFALMTMLTMGVVILSFSLEAGILLLLLVVLLIPYIRHYYILENGTQKLYRYYDRLEDMMNNKRLVALTFDDGPVEWNKESTAMTILNTLAEYGQQATFFYIGQQITESNSQEIQYAKSIGCEIANHTYTHAHLKELSESQIKEELDKTAEALHQITGEKPQLLRPPYIEYNDMVLEAVDIPMISCAIDTRDWDNESTQSIVNTVLTADKNGELEGAVVLMHSPYTTTAKAVQQLVPALVKNGYQIVTVSDLAKAHHITLEKHHIYTRL